MKEEAHMNSERESVKDFFEIYNTTILREGKEDLRLWMRLLGIERTPASSRHHLAVPGGLCRHSINVYRRLKWLCEAERARNPDFRMPTEESMAIVGLLHDLCKVGLYRQGSKGYSVIDEDFPFGHGEKSVYLIQKYMDLTEEEALAIRWHMASWNDGEKKQAGKVFEKHELALLLHMADELATFIDER